MPKKYSNTLKRDVIVSYSKNRSLNEIAFLYSIPKKTIEKWITKYRKEGDVVYTEAYIDKDKKIMNLEKQIIKMQTTIEILKKALAFSQNVKTSDVY